jgi:hypothetical protein
MELAMPHLLAARSQRPLSLGLPRRLRDLEPAHRGAEGIAILFAVGAPAQVSLILGGWALARYPCLVPPDPTTRPAAAPRIALVPTLRALGARSLVLFPSLHYLLRVFTREPAWP